MALLLVFHPLCRRLWNAVFPIPLAPALSPAVSKKPTNLSDPAADAHLNQRLAFDHAFAILYLVILHGVSAAKVLAILSINYQIATRLPRKLVPWATWAFNVGTLFANELSAGYRFHNLALALTGASPLPGVDQGSAASLVKLGRWLDGFGGIMSRWEILFNITVLRLISFNMDYYWSVERKAGVSLEVSPRLAVPMSLSHFVSFCQRVSRRNSWTRPISPSGIASPSHPRSRTTRSATTLHMPYTRPCI